MDRKDVIEDLGGLIIKLYLCNECPYRDDDVDDDNCQENLCADALELLKEGE